MFAHVCMCIHTDTVFSIYKNKFSHMGCLIFTVRKVADGARRVAIIFISSVRLQSVRHEHHCLPSHFSVNYLLNKCLPLIVFDHDLLRTSSSHTYKHYHIKLFTSLSIKPCLYGVFPKDSAKLGEILLLIELKEKCLIK